MALDLSSKSQMGKDNRQRERIVLAALLHDIGKFWQRADEHYSKSNSISKYYNSDNYNITVPLYENGNPKYVHSLWTNAFFSDTKTGSKLGLNDEGDKTLANLSANHHKPNNHEEAILSLADKWSSGIDRPDTGEEGVAGYEEVKKIYDKDFVKKVGLHSIFDTIHREYTEITTHHSFPITALDVSGNIFPKEETKDDLSADYKSLWDKFIEEYNLLLNKKSENFISFYESLLTVLKKYTWCIPSATNSLPANVSLYEHLKSTAAIALSLYDYCGHHNEELKLDENHRINNLPTEDSLLMVCIDISGIQKFIYDISNKRAAASLKGRSFYLELLLQNILNEVLGHPQINAYRSNIIYASGGKAYLILANILCVIEALDGLQESISKALFEENQGRLFVSIGYTSFRYKTTFGFIKKGPNAGSNGFLNEILTDEQHVLDRYLTTKDHEFCLSDLWRSVSDKASEKKNAKYRAIFIENYERDFLEGIDYEDEKFNCSVTGEWISGKPKEYLYPNETEESLKAPISQVVHDQIQIGRDLRTSNRILYFVKGNYATAGIGHKFSLKNDERLNVDSSIALNDWPDYSKHKHAERHLFYGGNYQPSIDNRPKTFEELCYKEGGIEMQSGANKKATTKLAVLRMDVDNLGQIFIKGFKQQSFAAYSTLSMLLDTFFSGYLNEIQKKNPLISEHVQILYSGGDDVFAVGRWDAIIEFADDINAGFKSFTQRPDITLSAGIVVVNPKYPIYKAAEEAGEAEHNAKGFESEELGNNNAISLFGEVVSWNNEWSEVKRLKDLFIKHNDDISASLLHSIQAYKLRKDFNNKEVEKNSDAKDLSFIWHSGYTLTRMMNRLEKKPEAAEFIKHLRDNIYHNQEYTASRFLDLAGLAAKWAEYNIKLNNS